VIDKLTFDQVRQLVAITGALLTSLDPDGNVTRNAGLSQVR
jgi:hypothetical protein